MQAPGINPTLTRLGKQIQKPDAENGESRLEHDLHIFRGEFSAGMGKTNPEVVTSTGQGLLSGRQLADSALGSGCIDGDISIRLGSSCNWNLVIVWISQLHFMIAHDHGYFEMTNLTNGIYQILLHLPHQFWSVAWKFVGYNKLTPLCQDGNSVIPRFVGIPFHDRLHRS